MLSSCYSLESTHAGKPDVAAAANAATIKRHWCLSSLTTRTIGEPSEGNHCSVHESFASLSSCSAWIISNVGVSLHTRHVQGLKSCSDLHSEEGAFLYTKRALTRLRLEETLQREGAVSLMTGWDLICDSCNRRGFGCRYQEQKPLRSSVIWVSTYSSPIREAGSLPSCPSLLSLIRV